MSDAPNPAPESGQDPLRDAHDDTLRDAQLEQQVLNLVRSWLRRSRESDAARTEAAIDRASFESFPASDPVAPAVASAERAPTLEEVDCTMTPRELVFRCAPREPDAGRPPPAWTIEGATGDGGRLRLRVWVDDAPPEAAVPATLELEPEHASIRARREERRSGEERRTLERSMPAGFDRRTAQRRADARAAQA
jgi:hypothetical protein